MHIKVIFDKVAERASLHIGWGVSFLVDGKVLFDTGEKGGWLLENMRQLGIAPEAIEAVVISHDHWDHWGGLWDLLKERKGMKVYACPGFSEAFKEKVKIYQGVLVEADAPRAIAHGIFTTGEIAGTYNGNYIAEQALVTVTERGISMLTGCAHPGVVKMAKEVRRMFPREVFYAVLGGFHLMKHDTRTATVVADDIKKLHIKKAGPTHCSGEKAEEVFKNAYGDDCIRVAAGKTFEV
jgi:7,8-dihydropterin-6-yl-methyl-4-(beta-D-ribofuranosyl)aminobenzene 5'-phosphate synthase